MADVKWIKITTDMFDNRKIKHLRRLPEGNSIILIWVMLLTMAGRCNSGGMIFLTKNIPYTPKMLADELDFEENTVILAIQALEQLNMIATNAEGFLLIPGWDEYQNIEGMDKIREQNRLRKQKQRENSKLLPDMSRNVTGQSRDSHATEEDKEEDIEKDKDKEGEKKEKCQKIVDIFNSLCPSFPKVKFLSDSMISNISNLVERFPESDISTAFQKCEKSSFLKGKNPRKWKASFDWIIKPQNLPKILNGNYDDEITSDASYDLSEFRRKSLNEPLKYERNKKK